MRAGSSTSPAVNCMVTAFFCTLDIYTIKRILFKAPAETAKSTNTPFSGLFCNPGHRGASTNGILRLLKVSVMGHFIIIHPEVKNFC